MILQALFTAVSRVFVFPRKIIVIVFHLMPSSNSSCELVKSAVHSLVCMTMIGGECSVRVVSLVYRMHTLMACPVTLWA